ncbi:hypothetical protein [Nannocystis punicea]|uniref:Uncharacterized protein n=1 Tax=Nannocystis punicea TaxID=2995304 RepID=A0ABY7H763_9BACT|nr:hypothetical protein [Nannocystis poenicansa]WAS95106.1 hypothetical protein O0S08_03005 [Nannocystis poenicansa]
MGSTRVLLVKQGPGLNHTTSSDDDSPHHERRAGVVRPPRIVW